MVSDIVNVFVSIKLVNDVARELTVSRVVLDSISRSAETTTRSLAGIDVKMDGLIERVDTSQSCESLRARSVGCPC